MSGGTTRGFRHSRDCDKSSGRLGRQVGRAPDSSVLIEGGEKHSLLELRRRRRKRERRRRRQEDKARGIVPPDGGTRRLDTRARACAFAVVPLHVRRITGAAEECKACTLACLLTEAETAVFGSMYRHDDDRQKR